MRTVSFSNKNVQNLLAADFHSTFTNTKGDPSSGASFSHSPDDQPGPCGKGAGRQNVQCIFMSRAGEIFHVAGGYLSGEDLAEEITFAKNIFAEIKNSANPKRVVADQHTRFLTKSGFSADQIRSGRVGMFGEGMPDFSPKDLGIEIPGGTSNQVFDQMHRRRTLADHRYCIENPMISKASFDQQPEKLVGTGKSFFGSNAAMNAAGPMFKTGVQSSKAFDQDRAFDQNKAFDQDLQRSFQFGFDRAARRMRFNR